MKLPFWATLFTFLGVLILCGLGSWQLQRLSWKTDLLAALEEAYDPKFPLPLYDSQDISNFYTAKKRLFRGKIKGFYLGDEDGRPQRFFIKLKPYKGKLGAYVYEPFLMKDGGVIFVRRGWIDTSQIWNYLLSFRFSLSNLNLIQEKNLWEEETGLFLEPPKPNRFTPENTDTDYYSIDFGKMAEKIGIKPEKVSFYILYADKKGGNESLPEGPVTFDDLITNVESKPSLNNNHLGYALFWFTMAGILTVIYALRFIRKPA